MLFNQNKIDSRLTDDDFAKAPAATLNEAFTSEYELFVDQQQFASTELALRDAYQNDIDRIQTMTGRSIENPFIAPNREAASIRQGFKQASDLDTIRNENISAYWEQVGKLSEEGLLEEGVALSSEEIKQRVREERQTQREEAQAVKDRTLGIGANVAGFSGNVAGALTDPVNIASLALGAPLSAGVVRTALIEGGIGIGSEAIIQAEVQTSRREIGEEPSFSEAAEAVLFAGVGGAAVGASVKGAAKGYRGLVNKAKRIKNPTKEVKTAIDDLEKVTEVYDSTPSPDIKTHLANTDEANKAAREGRTPDIKELPSSSADTTKAKEIVQTLLDEGRDDLLIQAARSTPEVQDLKKFVASQGGVSFDEAGRTGRPGKVFSKGGVELGEMASRAQAEGFEVQADNLVDLLTSSNPVIRGSDAGKLKDAETARVIRQGMKELGINPTTARTSDRIRGQLRNAQTEVEVEPVTKEQVDDISLKDLAGNEDLFVPIEDDLGNVRFLKPKEIIEQNDRIDTMIEDLNTCFTGASR